MRPSYSESPLLNPVSYQSSIPLSKHGWDFCGICCVWFILLRVSKGIKVKFSLCLINYALCHEDIWRSGGISPPFLTSALDGGEWSASRPGRFTPWGKSPLYPLDRRAPEPVWTLWRRETFCSAGNRTRAVQSVARCYTDSSTL
jgi:hypothetical protein